MNGLFWRRLTKDLLCRHPGGVCLNQSLRNDLLCRHPGGVCLNQSLGTMISRASRGSGGVWERDRTICPRFERLKVRLGLKKKFVGE